MFRKSLIGARYDMKKNNNNTIDETELNNKVIRDKTFVVKIKYSQNQSIQGSIQWIDKKKVVNFRSMMELMLLLSESVDNKDIRSWEDEEGALSLINL
jgi:hypothetical protein